MVPPRLPDLRVFDMVERDVRFRGENFLGLCLHATLVGRHRWGLR